MLENWLNFFPEQEYPLHCPGQETNLPSWKTQVKKILLTYFKTVWYTKIFLKRQSGIKLSMSLAQKTCSSVRDPWKISTPLQIFSLISLLFWLLESFLMNTSFHQLIWLMCNQITLLNLTHASFNWGHHRHTANSRMMQNFNDNLVMPRPHQRQLPSLTNPIKYHNLP